MGLNIPKKFACSNHQPTTEHFKNHKLIGWLVQIPFFLPPAAANLSGCHLQWIPFRRCRRGHGRRRGGPVHGRFFFDRCVSNHLPGGYKSMLLTVNGVFLFPSGCDPLLLISYGKLGRKRVIPNVHVSSFLYLQISLFFLQNVAMVSFFWT